jgi:hypothetical protein
VPARQQAINAMATDLGLEHPTFIVALGVSRWRRSA